MSFPNKYNLAVVLVTVSMLIILPVLAYLQYTWLGQLSEQEYERMRNNLQTTAFRCSMDFSREVTNLMKSLGGTLEGSENHIQAELATRIAKWKAIAEHPQLISGIVSIVKYPSFLEADSIWVDEHSSLLFYKNLSAIVLPINDKSNHIATIPLDLSYIMTSLLPELIRTYFLSNDSREYDLVITDKSGGYFFSTTKEHLNGIIETADVVVPFFFTPPVPLSRMPMNPPTFTLNFPDAPDRNRTRAEEPGKRRMFPPQEDNGLPRDERRMEDRSNLSKLYLKHRIGSLESIVNTNRQRNIGISFGVLLLLGASTIFLLLSASRAQRLAQQQLEFVAGVSHELRTPLSVLQSVGENLADGVIQEKGRERQYGEVIKNEVFRLSDLVEKALAYAGIQSGKKIYEFHQLNISDVIKNAIQEAKKRIPKNDFKFDVAIEPDLPEILGDDAIMQSALENLIINSIKYDRGKKWIGIEAKKNTHTRKPSIEITIRDRGIGIASSDMRNVFKPFHRGKNAMNDQIEGSGLGLSITKQYIEAHGGKISVKSSLNEGTTFMIQLPIQTH